MNFLGKIHRHLPKLITMEIEVLKSKVHRAVITEANLNYVGSLTLDEDLMEAANLIENEKVQVVNVNNGERIETYIIKGKRGSGVVCLNGPAARKGAEGDIVITSRRRYCNYYFLCQHEI